MHYAITALWTAAHYQIPITVVVASNSEYGVFKEFGVWDTFGLLFAAAVAAAAVNFNSDRLFYGCLLC
jgi:thiamine pyrophosphate-dependent acetolactate synthase large subunit-like protein